jgi:hypothetical protein
MMELVYFRWLTSTWDFLKRKIEKKEKEGGERRRRRRRRQDSSDKKQKRIKQNGIEKPT